MKIVLMIVGGLVILFGVVDFGGSFAGFDVWTELGVSLPTLVWKYSAYAELLVGYLLFKVGSAAAEVKVATETESA